MRCRLGISERTVAKAQRIVDTPKNPRGEGIVNLRCGEGILAEPAGEIGPSEPGSAVGASYCNPSGLNSSARILSTTESMKAETASGSCARLG